MTKLSAFYRELLTAPEAPRPPEAVPFRLQVRTVNGESHVFVNATWDEGTSADGWVRVWRGEQVIFAIPYERLDYVRVLE